MSFSLVKFREVGLHEWLDVIGSCTAVSHLKPGQLLCFRPMTLERGESRIGRAMSPKSAKLQESFRTQFAHREGLENQLLWAFHGSTHALQSTSVTDCVGCMPAQPSSVLLQDGEIRQGNYACLPRFRSDSGTQLSILDIAAFRGKLAGRT